MPETQPPDSQTFDLTVPSDLSPADAEAVRERALTALGAAKEAGESLALSLDGDRATPCAVQIVVAASRSSAAANVDLAVSAETQAVLAGLGVEIGNGN